MSTNENVNEIFKVAGKTIQQLSDIEKQQQKLILEITTKAHNIATKTMAFQFETQEAEFSPMLVVGGDDKVDAFMVSVNKPEEIREVLASEKASAYSQEAKSIVFIFHAVAYVSTEPTEECVDQIAKLSNNFSMKDIYEGKAGAKNSQLVSEALVTIANSSVGNAFISEKFIISPDGVEFRSTVKEFFDDEEVQGVHAYTYDKLIGMMQNV